MIILRMYCLDTEALVWRQLLRLYYSSDFH